MEWVAGVSAVPTPPTGAVPLHVSAGRLRDGAVAPRGSADGVRIVRPGPPEGGRSSKFEIDFSPTVCITLLEHQKSVFCTSSRLQITFCTKRLGCILPLHRATRLHPSLAPSDQVQSEYFITGADVRGTPGERRPSTLAPIIPRAMDSISPYSLLSRKQPALLQSS